MFYQHYTYSINKCNSYKVTKHLLPFIYLYFSYYSKHLPLYFNTNLSSLILISKKKIISTSGNNQDSTQPLKLNQLIWCDFVRALIAPPGINTANINQNTTKTTKLILSQRQNQNVSPKKSNTANIRFKITNSNKI